MELSLTPKQLEALSDYLIQTNSHAAYHLYAALDREVTPIGSFLGGIPFFLPTHAYPKIDGQPLSFIAQINLADLAQAARGFSHELSQPQSPWPGSLSAKWQAQLQLLPASGLLQFFVVNDSGLSMLASCGACQVVFWSEQQVKSAAHLSFDTHLQTLKALLPGEKFDFIRSPQRISHLWPICGQVALDLVPVISTVLEDSDEVAAALIMQGLKQLEIAPKELESWAKCDSYELLQRMFDLQLLPLTYRKAGYRLAPDAVYLGSLLGRARYNLDCLPVEDERSLLTLINVSLCTAFPERSVLCSVLSTTNLSSFPSILPNFNSPLSLAWTQAHFQLQKHSLSKLSYPGNSLCSQYGAFSTSIKMHSESALSGANLQVPADLSNHNAATWDSAESTDCTESAGCNVVNAAQAKHGLEGKKEQGSLACKAKAKGRAECSLEQGTDCSMNLARKGRAQGFVMHWPCDNFANFQILQDDLAQHNFSQVDFRWG